MKITPKTAARCLRMIRFDGTPEVAAHQARVQLRALGGYTDRNLSACIEVLDYISRQEGERRERTLGQLVTIGATDTQVAR